MSACIAGGQGRHSVMFLRNNRDDSDFSAFMPIGFCEEQRQALVLMEYLKRFSADVVPSEAELHNVGLEFDAAQVLETLMLPFCGEFCLNHRYRRASEWHTEFVIKSTCTRLSQNEARHGGAYLRSMRRAIHNAGLEARPALANVGALMASARRRPCTLPTCAISVCCWVAASRSAGSATVIERNWGSGAGTGGWPRLASASLALPKTV